MGSMARRLAKARKPKKPGLTEWQNHMAMALVQVWGNHVIGGKTDGQYSKKTGPGPEPEIVRLQHAPGPGGHQVDAGTDKQ